MVYFVQNVQKYRRYKEFEIYVEISTGTTISQEMLKQTVNKNNIHVPVGVSQVSQLVVMILLINDCYVMSLVVIISRMNLVLYRNTYFYNTDTSEKWTLGSVPLVFEWKRFDCKILLILICPSGPCNFPNILGEERY